MNKGIKIGITIGIPFSIFIILILLDINSAQQLQFMAVESEEFDFIDLSIDGTDAVCNPTSFPTSFDKINTRLYYKSTEIAQMTIWGDSIPANQAKEVPTRVNINGQNVIRMIAGGFFGSFSGKKPEFDQNDFSVYLKIDKSILGFIPYSQEKRISGGNIDEFQKWFVTPDKITDWKCG